ncbi:Copper binding protein, plastocyanin/azurin family [hydrothermal vent metagenome]|uniref:Copper binding protein, plastocyanin/azurin family n=1 Tax=hydrothermal vent metagenome TaxID=652676 RepID=A0A3B0V7T0_9ZZZZ
MKKVAVLLGLLFCTTGYSVGDVIFQNDFEPLQLWSNPASWVTNSVPVNGDEVVIPAGQQIYLDVDTANLAGLTIDGSLTFLEQDLTLSSDIVYVNGRLQIGSTSQPFINKAIINLTGNNSGGNPLSRGLIITGSLELHGATPPSVWNKIDQHIQPGDQQIQILDASGWSVGDQIVIAPTDFYGVSESQMYQISAVSGNQLTLDTPVVDFHWGLIQYATQSGMSLINNNPVIPPANTGFTPTQLDERAEVGNLTRNIVIQGANDSLWQNEGFGAHTMIMNLNATVHVDGVEFNRVGQAGVLARYPMHWHRLSYNELGMEVGDVNNQYLRNSSIHNSGNRCITIHATNGILLENNICFDVLGHAIFLEDAVERRNVIVGNLVLKVRFPTTANALKLHDLNTQSGVVAGSSGLWASNPDNTIINNTFADAQGFGLWLAFPASPVGPSSNVPILPYRMAFGNFDGNTMHSNGQRGIMFDNSEIDDLGNVAPLQYASTTTDGETVWDNLQRFTITGWSLWKNGTGNLWDRVVWPTFEEFVTADSSGKYFAGSGADGLITRTLFVGSSLNNFSPRPNPWMGPPTALATYHSAFNLSENIIINFPFVEGKTSGAFATDDYYFRPVEKGHIRNTNNLLINSHAGYRSNVAVDEEIAFNFAQGFNYYVFASALWDPQGLWGVAGNWNVYNQPFLTHNANCNPIAPISQNAASCDGQYFGIDRFILDQANQDFDDLMPINVIRFADNDINTVVDQWSVTGAQPGWALGHMRHFAVRNNGQYLLDFPGASLPVDVAISIENMHDSSSAFLLGIRYSGNEDALVFSSTYEYVQYIADGHAAAGSWANKHDYTELASRQQVIDSTGETYWQDTVNNIVWVKVAYANLVQINPGNPEDIYSEEVLYNDFHLRIWSNN